MAIFTNFQYSTFMQNYISQLISDIHKASWNIRPPHECWLDTGADPDYDLELEDMSFAEKYIYGEEVPIEEMTGINTSQLPAPELLSEEQRAILAEELEKLLCNYHFKLEFPSSYPGHLRYGFIRKFWTESHVQLSFGENEIEFCDMDESECPFPGYCDICKEVAAQMKADEEQSKGDYDFDIKIEDLLPSREDFEKTMKEIHNLNNKINYGDDPFSIDEDELENLPFSDDPFDNDVSFDDELVAVPGLCVVCQLYANEEDEDNLFCIKKRLDHRNGAHFECNAFKSIK